MSSAHGPKNGGLRCQICLRDLKALRFKTEHIKICKKCVEDLNSYHAVATDAVDVFEGRLEKGVSNRRMVEMNSEDRATQLRAEREFNNLEDTVDKALPNWLNNVLKDGRSKEHKVLRAFRRGLLHFDRPQTLGYPDNWEKIAKRIRLRDKFACRNCGVSGTEIHVHHIVYVSHFGSHRQNNLVSLCKSCHEEEHGRELDFGEKNERNALGSDVLEMPSGKKVESDEPYMLSAVKPMPEPIDHVLAVKVSSGSTASGGLDKIQSVEDLEHFLKAFHPPATTHSNKVGLKEVRAADSGKPPKHLSPPRGIDKFIKMLKAIFSGG